MSDEARRGYGVLARLFLIVGGAFTLLALLQMAGVIGFFHGNPLGVALVTLAIGAALWWTVRTAPPPPVDGGPEAEAEEPEEPEEGGGS